MIRLLKLIYQFIICTLFINPLSHDLVAKIFKFSAIPTKICC